MNRRNFCAKDEVKAIVANPALFAEDPLRSEFARAVDNAPPPPRAEPVKYPSNRGQV